MARQVQVCRPSDSLADAEKAMRETRIRRLPVVDEQDALVGMISLADLAQEAAREAFRELRENDKLTKIIPARFRLFGDRRPPVSARSAHGDQCHPDFTAGMDRQPERCGSCKLRRGLFRPPIHRSSFDDRVLVHFGLARRELDRVHHLARLCGASHHRDGRHQAGAMPEPAGFAAIHPRCKNPHHPSLRRRSPARDRCLRLIRARRNVERPETR